MNELKRYAIVISVVDELAKFGSWCGETHIQKTIYYIEKLFPGLIDYPYMLYKHGPFSFPLRDDLGIMVAERFLRLMPMFPYGPQMLPGELATNIKKLFPRALSQHEKKIKFAAEKLGSKGVVELETLGTALYITEELLPNTAPQKREEKLRELKPHIPFEDAKRGIEEVDQILREADQLA